MTSSPIAGEREALSEDEWLELAERHASKDWNADGYLDAVKALCKDFAALLEPVGEGWVMVPVEPTEEMLTRAVYAIACGTAREVALKHYRAMIAASPKSNGGMGS